MTKPRQKNEEDFGSALFLPTACQTPTRNSNGKTLFGADFDFSLYSPIGVKIEISSEKRVSVRISSRSLVQSIGEGLENTTPLGTKFKKKYKNFFYDPLRPRKRIPQMKNSHEFIGIHFV